MTLLITTPPYIDPLPIPPSTTDIVNFDKRGDEFNDHLQAKTQPQINAVAANVYNNALATKANADDVATKAAATAANAALAAGYAGATAWTNQVYIGGEKRYSLIDGRVYRRLTPGGGALDPSADALNWRIDNNAPLLRKEVIGTAQAGAVGYDYWAINAAATVLTLPAAPADGDEMAFTPANGLKTNAIDSGAITVRGPAGTASGVITLDLGVRMQLKYSATLTLWVML